MKGSRQVCVVALAVLLSAAVSGCAGFSRCTPDNCSADAKITSDVSEVLAEHRELGPPAAIHVQTVHGVVYLTGLVDTDLEVRRAEAMVLQVANVKDVVNSLTTRNAGR
jgi:osmotically-inducible protein OsmY